MKYFLCLVKRMKCNNIIFNILIKILKYKSIKQVRSSDCFMVQWSKGCLTPLMPMESFHHQDIVESWVVWDHG